MFLFIFPQLDLERLQKETTDDSHINLLGELCFYGLEFLRSLRSQYYHFISQSLYKLIFLYKW